MPTSPVPLQRTKPALSCAPPIPRDPPPRHLLLPKPGSRHDRHSDSDIGKLVSKMDDPNQRLDTISATNGGAGVTVSRALSFQGRRPPLPAAAALREGILFCTLNAVPFRSS